MIPLNMQVVEEILKLKNKVVEEIRTQADRVASIFRKIFQLVLRLIIFLQTSLLILIT